MKIRNGFVSNSSSSSFIVGVARIINYEKFLQVISENPYFMEELRFFEKSDIVKLDNWSINCTNDILTVESFDQSASINVSKMSDTDKIIYLDITNDEGDIAFSINGDYYCDYDIDFDFFSEKQQELYLLFKNAEIVDISNCEIFYGAGRNG